MFGSNAKTQANAFKQSAFLDAEYLKGFSPKMFNVARKRLFTSLSYFKYGSMDLNEGVPARFNNS